MLSSSFIEMRKRNALSIVQTVRRQPGLSRADVARICDLARSTVSSVVDELVQCGLLEETGSKVSSRGRRPVGLTFNEDARVVVGVSLEHNRIEIALCDLNGTVKSVRTKKHNERNELQSIAPLVLAEVKSAVGYKGAATYQIAAIGLAVPGPVQSTSFYHALKKLLEEQMTCSVVLDSNANMAALAESRLGAARNSDEALVVRLGHEVRAAFITDGKLRKGAGDKAGALGHIVVPDNNEVCQCGKRGCINSVAAPEVIVRRCKHAGHKVRDIDDVIAAALHGNKSCRKAVKDAGWAVGYGVASCINLLAPSDLIVTGRLVSAGSIFLDSLNEALEKFVIAENLRVTRVTFDDAKKHIEAVGASFAVLAVDGFMLDLLEGIRVVQDVEAS